jgi:HAMP domain-containing protein
MRRESHVRFREGLGVKFPRATRPLHELIGAVDLAEAIDAVATETAQEILSLATRLKRMLRALPR